MLNGAVPVDWPTGMRSNYRGLKLLSLPGKACFSVFNGPAIDYNLHVFFLDLAYAS